MRDARAQSTRRATNLSFFVLVIVPLDVYANRNEANMKITQKICAAALLGLALGFSPIASAGAGVLVVGAPGIFGNSYPFGDPVYWAPEYQQVYGSSNFPGPLSINGLVFYNSAPTGTPLGGDFTISLSTTSAPIGGLARPAASNIGADNTIVFTGALPSLSGNQFIIQFSTSFNYDPSHGNLLLDVTGTNLVSNGGLALDENLSGLYFSRLYGADGAFGSGTDNKGLVTGFEFGAAPVPGPTPGAGIAGLACLALAVVALRARRLIG